MVFWPDLATIHYTKTVTEKVVKNVILAMKDKNLPKTPHLRPIEKFWALCKKKFFQVHDKVDILRKFRFKGQKISNEVGLPSGKAILADVNKQIQKRNG